MPTGIDAAVENPLPVMLAGQLVMVYAMFLLHVNCTFEVTVP